jgi:uncharacterized membrane protein
MKTSLIVVFLLALLVALPLFHAGYFPSHDGEWAVVRLADMIRTLRDFQFPARYSGFLNHGYGYPLFNFTYPLPYYLGAVVRLLLPISLVGTVKLLFAASVILSGLGMFLAARAVWKSHWAALVCAALYIYLPYRVVDLYARGSIGESLSFIWFPLIIWAMKTQRLLLGSLFFAALVLTHNIMAVLFLPVVAAFVFLEGRRTILILILGMGMAAFFWLPALAEKPDILLSKIPIADRALYFVRPWQLVAPKWGYGIPTDAQNSFGYQLGLAQIGAIVLSLFCLRKNKYVFVIVGLVSALVLLMFPISKKFWEIVPLLKEINYPWTLLAPIGFLTSLLAGGVIKKPVIGIILIGVAIVTVLPFAHPEKFFDKGDGYYLTNDATTTSSDELMPLWVRDAPTDRFSQKAEILSGSGTISDLKFSSKATNFKVFLDSPARLRLSTIYFPGWQVEASGKNIPIDFENSRGLIEFSLPAGDFNVSANFTDTPVRGIANLLSVISLGALLWLKLKPSFRS